MSVQARFFVQKISSFAATGGDQGTVELGAVARGPENRSWSAATPSGAMTMTITNPDAFVWFRDRLGKEVAITIEERPAICDVCHEEVAAGYTQPEDQRGTTDYPSQQFRHVGCGK